MLKQEPNKKSSFPTAVQINHAGSAGDDAPFAKIVCPEVMASSRVLSTPKDPSPEHDDEEV